jgi:hypothetical protein
MSSNVVRSGSVRGRASSGVQSRDKASPGFNRPAPQSECGVLPWGAVAFGVRRSRSASGSPVPGCPASLWCLMRSAYQASAEYLASVGLFLLSGLGLLVVVLLSADSVLAQQPASTDPRGGRAPGIVVSPPADPDAATSTMPDLRAWLVEADAAAALDHVRIALTEVGDGQTYVWHRHHGRLSGTVRPTASFVAKSGRLCRHIVMTMAAGGHANQTEGVACRLETGRWQLEG